MLLHPTSLPSGQLDDDVERWLQFMHYAGLSVWQMLPLVIPDHTGSPYQSCSAFAVDPALINTLDASLLHGPSLNEFIFAESHWVHDFALFQQLKEHFDGLPWMQWPEQYRDRDADALHTFRQQHEEAISAIIVQQYHLEQRWWAIRRIAEEYDILLFGDMPIFVALDSADVWANRDEFLLDEYARPEYVAGVPPDYFSETGQRWGNPHYNWDVMQANGFRWWRARLKRQLAWFDLVRLDHFRGLVASWMIPAESETAVDGFWQTVPGEALLAALKEDFPALPIVAEDLGVITPEVTALRREFGLPGMGVLQFAFDDFDDNPHKPKNITADTVVYSGTHDNDTTCGWLETLPGEQRAFVCEVLESTSCDDICGLINSGVLNTRANLAILPLQDILGLGAEARMNTPGSTGNNWNWRFDWDALPGKLAVKVRHEIDKAGRLHER